MKMFKGRTSATSLFVSLCLILLLLTKPAYLHAAVYEYSYQGQNFTTGVGADFASSYPGMFLTINFTTTLSPTTIASGSINTFFSPLSFSMSDTVRTYTMSDQGAMPYVDIISTNGVVPTEWQIGINQTATETSTDYGAGMYSLYWLGLPDNQWDESYLNWEKTPYQMLNGGAINPTNGLGWSVNVVTSTVPIPGAVLLFTPGLLGLLAIKKRFSKRMN